MKILEELSPIIPAKDALVIDEMIKRNGAPFEIRFAQMSFKMFKKFATETAPGSPENHMAWMFRILFLAGIPFTLDSIKTLCWVYLLNTYEGFKRSPKAELKENSIYYKIAGKEIFDVCLNIVRKARSQLKNRQVAYTRFDTEKFVLEYIKPEVQLMLTVSAKNSNCAAVISREIQCTDFDILIESGETAFKPEVNGYYFPNIKIERREVEEL
jgi:hypothetical protein